MLQRALALARAQHSANLEQRIAAAHAGDDVQVVLRGRSAGTT
jgi:hypothetical protein